MSIKHHKVVGVLPVTLDPNSIYYVRSGSGFDHYVTNSTGVIVAYPQNQIFLTSEEIQTRYESLDDVNRFNNDYKKKLTDIETGAQKNIPSNMSIKANTTNAVISNSNGTGFAIPLATTTLAGLITPAEKGKISNIDSSLLSKINKTDISTSLGNSDVNPISQKAVTDAINALPTSGATLKLEHGFGQSTTSAMTQKAVTDAIGDVDRALGLLLGEEVGGEFEGIQTNLGIYTDKNLVTLTSSTGTGVNIPIANGEHAGLMTPSQVASLEDLDGAASMFVSPIAAGVSRSINDKLSDFVHASDLGLIGDGTTDNYHILMKAISDCAVYNADPNLGPNIIFPEGTFAFSQTISLKRRVKFIGQWTNRGKNLGTVFGFPKNTNGIIIQSNTSVGSSGNEASTTSGEGSVISGINLVQSGYRVRSQRVLEYNKELGLIMADSKLPWTLLNNSTIVATNDLLQQKFSANVIQVDNPTGFVAPLTILPTAKVGDTITGVSSKASAVICFIGVYHPIYMYKNLVGEFAVGENIKVNGADGGLLIAAAEGIEKILHIYHVTGSVGDLDSEDILLQQDESGIGILLRGTATISNVQVNSWPQHGIAVITNTPTPTNANGFVIEHIKAGRCGMHGVYLRGSDSNAGTLYKVNASGNGGCAIRDDSLLGNTHTGHHSSANNIGDYHTIRYNNSSTFIGCYSEGAGNSHDEPFPFRESRFGRQTTVIGGTLATGSNNPREGFYPTTLNGGIFSVGKGIYLTKNNMTDTGILNNGGMTLNGGKTVQSLAARGSLSPNSSIGSSYFLPVGSTGTNIAFDNSDLTESAYVGVTPNISGGLNKGTVFGVDLIKKTTAKTKLIVSGGGLAARGIHAIFEPVIVGGKITDLRMLFAGDGYTSTVKITGAGEWSGVEASAIVSVGKVLMWQITTNTVTGATPLVTTRALSVSHDNIIAGVDNTTTLGTANTRFKDIFATTGVINTSDGNLKTSPILISDEVLDAWGDVNFISFQWLHAVASKGENSARWHFGVIAQQVRDVFLMRGLDGTKFGLLCHDVWDEQLEVTESIESVENNTTFMAIDGYSDNASVAPLKVVIPYKAQGERWGIRADQCLFLEAAYQRRRSDRIEARLLILEDSHE